jgi:hypothetical protein
VRINQACMMPASLPPFAPSPPPQACQVAGASTHNLCPPHTPTRAQVDPFLFLKPFSPDVWLLMFATSLFVGIAVLFAEVRAGAPCSQASFSTCCH